MEFFYTAKVTNDTGELIDVNKLIEKVEKPKVIKGDYNKAKANAECIGAHDLPTSKRKAPVLKHDNFTMLRLDLDVNAPGMKDIVATLKDLDFSRFVVYSTAKHKQIKDVATGEAYGNRFRVLIPLANPLTYKDWLNAQIGLSLSIPFEADSCADRPQQIMYLPVKYDGDAYVYEVIDGANNADNAIARLCTAGVEVRAEEAKEAEKKKVRPSTKILPDKPRGKGLSIINLYNMRFTVEDVLREYKYICNNKNKWLSPYSTSGNPGGVVLESHTDGKRRYYTHSETEQSRLGLEPGRSFDAFDMYCYLECGGDRSEAVRSAAQKYFPTVHKHNRREYKIAERNKAVMAYLKALGGAA